jgi:tRNA(His) guanylyltransferase
MYNFKLKNRIESYQDQTDYKLLSKLPVITIVNGRSFVKTTSLLEKPFSEKFSECMLSVAIKLCSEIEGAIFAYHHNDEIIVVSRNDQSMDTEPWIDNRVQKLSSITSSIATLQFINCLSNFDLNLLGEPHFYSTVFTVPNIGEAINTIVYKQQQNFYNSIQLACFYELSKKHDRNYIKDMLQGLSFDEKIELLLQECNIDFHKYPPVFRRGAACYKVPTVIGENMKNKWTINMDLPIFSKDQPFLGNLFKLGHDLFRAS